MHLGVIGGGQLGRMLAEAGRDIGVRTTFLEAAPNPSAGGLGEVIVAPYDDEAALDRLAEECDAVTYEFENVPVEAVRYLAGKVPIHPGPGALEQAQDRLVEKRFFRSRGIDTAGFEPVDDVAQLRAAIDKLGLPAILKTRRMGYDGKGQLYLADPEQAEGAFATLGGVPCILEQVVAFDRELSILAVRDRSGNKRTWPLVENRHAGGILHWSEVPAPGVTTTLQQEADSIADRLLEAQQYVGVLAVELFQVGDRLLANEMAPRVHNSGHWSIEGALTSQFDNHVRAVLGLPLGSTEVPVPTACANLLGNVPDLSELLAIDGARVHLYGKAPRPGRKLGHVTVQGATPAQLRERLEAVLALTASGA
ncbi:MAG: 5-(carboxyamino)imidazole ribonucleotide synthase [Myxococcales bacterium]|nr:5-(carboxyamino)imidazole ribonucleotide synthase [Myxococcales bacterium]